MTMINTINAIKRNIATKGITGNNNIGMRQQHRSKKIGDPRMHRIGIQQQRQHKPKTPTTGCHHSKVVLLSLSLGSGLSPDVVV
jgi:hypothetical protein